MPILQLGKLRLGKVKQLAQGHTSNKWQRIKIRSVNLEPVLLTSILYCLLTGKQGARTSYPKQEVTW